MSRTRLYELARDLGVPSSELLNFLNTRGMYIRSASSPISRDATRQVKEHFAVPTLGPKPTEASTERNDRSISSNQGVHAQAKAIFGDDQDLRFRRSPTSPKGHRLELHSKARDHIPWARLMFTPKERSAWVRDGVQDADLAAAYRMSGLVPGDLSRIIHGRSGREWLASGISAPRLASAMARYRSLGADTSP